MRPPPVGDATAIKALRSVIFTGIEAAAVVHPKGLATVRWASLLGWLGPLLTVHATGPLPASSLYVALTPDELRIYGKGTFAPPFEVGRWKKKTYRASIPESGANLKLDLELERLGRIRLVSGLRALSSSTRLVFDLVVQGASGPVA